MNLLKKLIVLAGALSSFSGVFAQGVVSIPTAFKINGDLIFKGSQPLASFVRVSALDNINTSNDADIDRLQLSLRDLSSQLSSEFARIGRQIDALNQELDDKINEVAALNAALDFQRPAAGKNYRVSTGFGQFQNKTAVGVGFTGVYNAFDYGVGISFSSNQFLSKGSVGWSF